MIQTLLIWSIAAPLAVMLAVLFAAVILRRVSRIIDRMVSNAGMVVAGLALSYGVSHIGLGHDWHLSFPPGDVKMWLVYYLPIPVLITFYRLHTRMNWPVRFIVDTLLFGGFSVLLLWNMVSGDGGLWNAVLQIGGLGLGYAFLVMFTETSARRLPALMFLFPVGLWIAVCAVMFGMMASVNTGMQTGAVGAAVGVVFVSVWLGGKVQGNSKERGKEWSVVVPIVLYLVMGNGMEVYYFSYAEKPLTSIALAASGIILSGLVVLGGSAWLGRKPRRGVIIVTMLMVVPALAGVVIAYYANVAGS